MENNLPIKSIYDPSFRKYGQILNYDFKDVLERLKQIEVSKDKVIYVPSVKELEESSDFLTLQNDFFGGLPIQIGYCGGFNKIFAALEYHKSSEINVANESFILVLGKREDIIDGQYDMSKVEVFLVPEKVAVEIYATTLHYSPISNGSSVFNMLVVLPKETNVGSYNSKTDPMLRANNKWLLAHKDSKEAKNNAYIGLIGNIIEFY